ncbi:hypothetical protein H8L32_13780 [Undibacterium sp. CY18W]|uniref:Uncharacterized protein n=1 Tax=Undibacterium hunanense TaxID=2762292 RepID=A0ABR6ZRT2_9BURK|nr:hypothetical protein [Undibacterium hunanense]MBC3918558.1 hypothetical protein [Undibacterium hunanense]
MKKTLSFKTLSLLSVSLSCMAAPVLAADYNPYPKAGVYDASDNGFERLLTVKPDGKFTLEVSEKGKSGNLRSGSGEGKLADAPGGWNFSEGRCNMTLKRAAGGMQLHVETCASAWGDVPFDGKYKYQGEEVAAAPAKPAPAAVAAPAPKAATPAPAASTMPAPAAEPAGAATMATSTISLSRKEWKDKWGMVTAEFITGHFVQVLAQRSSDNPTGPGLDHYSNAAVIVDTINDYEKASAAEMAKPPLKQYTLPLPVVTAKEGVKFETECSYGKSAMAFVISVDSYGKGNILSRKRVSGWMLDSKLQLTEVKPASKVKCPQTSAFY